MIKFYLTRDGEIVSVRGKSYCDGQNFFRFDARYLGNEDFLVKEVVPPDDLAQAHREKWKFVSASQSGKFQQASGERPIFGA